MGVDCFATDPKLNRPSFHCRHLIIRDDPVEFRRPAITELLANGFLNTFGSFVEWNGLLGLDHGPVFRDARPAKEIERPCKSHSTVQYSSGILLFPN